ncbi:MAG: hypothetical protein ACSHX9_11235 [Luteolibacter sp.]
MNDSTENHAWFHCGKCGSLFESVPGFSEKRVCGNCERPPGTGVWAPPEIEEEVGASSAVSSESVEDGLKRNIRKKQPKNMMMRFIIIWIFIMAMAVWIRSHSTRVDEVKQNREEVHRSMAEGTLADQKIALLNEVLPDCHRSLSGFFMGGTPEIRNQFVFDPISNAAQMAAFYGMNSLEKVDITKLHRIGQESLTVGNERMISSRWKETEGAEFDAIFRNDTGTWKLDWEHFSRYSDYPWTLFLAGEGPEEGEFRLLARRLLDGDTEQQSGGRTSIVLMAPIFGQPLEAGEPSPEFVMDRRSDAGLLLGAAFSAQAKGETLFGAKAKAMESEEFVRVRVRVRREAIGDENKFHLEEVLACHWISSSDRGYDLEKLRYDIFGD